MKNLILILSIVSTLIFMTQCRKDETVDSDTNSSKWESTSEIYFNEINEIADQVEKNGTTGLRLSEEQQLLSGCATISFDTNQFLPDTTTVDFGSGCFCNDGKTRSGKLLITKTGDYFTTGTVITITPQSYAVNQNLISGYRKITNTGVNQSNQPVFAVEVVGTITLSQNGGIISWTANRTRTWIEGFNTPGFFADDVISITGGSTGTLNSESWESVINTPLIYKRACSQFVSGSRTVTPTNRPERLVNYGDGNCDNTATVTINGNIYTITLN